MELFGLSFLEILVILVVAILVFGPRLPQVAGETAATLQRFKRTLSDLRRETGIDQEIYRAKREFEEAARQARAANPTGAVQRAVREAQTEIQGAIASQPAPTEAHSAPAQASATPPRSGDPATQAPD
jgi:TatA/E family protein of Tat protein translocase